MNKQIWLIVFLAIIMVVLVGVLLWPSPAKTPQTPLGIQIISPKSGEIVSSPLMITGIVTGDGWSGFEGQVGQVILFDNNGKILGRGVLTATTEWTVLPTKFETTIEFTVPDTATGSLQFENENPSGMQGKYKEFYVPVKFK